MILEDVLEEFCGEVLGVCEEKWARVPVSDDSGHDVEEL